MTPSVDVYPVQSVPPEYPPADLVQPVLADEPETDEIINERRALFENPDALRMLRSL